MAASRRRRRTTSSSPARRRARNAIVHATDPTEPDFELTGTRSNGEISLVVRDFGHWREPDPARDSGGYGLKLMEALMDDVQVMTEDTGTEVRLRRRLRGARHNGGTAPLREQLEHARLGRAAPARRCPRPIAFDVELDRPAVVEALEDTRVDVGVAAYRRRIRGSRKNLARRM